MLCLCNCPVCAHCSLSILFLLDRNRIRCSLYCAFLDNFLLTTVNIGYLSQLSLPVSLSQSGHSPLTFLITKAFPSTELPLNGHLSTDKL